MHWFLKFIFGIKLHVSDSSSVHHQEFFTVHAAMVYVIQLAYCTQAVNKPLWHIPLLCVQWKTPDDGQRNCPKHLKFYSKNKFEKLVHLIGFIIRFFTMHGHLNFKKKVESEVGNWTQLARDMVLP